MSESLFPDLEEPKRKNRAIERVTTLGKENTHAPLDGAHTGAIGECLQQVHACIECAKFSGRSRDKLAWLFRMKKGYCDDPRHHPGGVWAVVQDIVKKHACAFFEAADPALVDQRIKAIEYYEGAK